MKKYDTPWEIGSVFICNKCGIAFNEPESAEKLKSSLRTQLKSIDAHKKIRVMVTGCLSVCNKDEQTVMYQPVNGKSEVFTVGTDSTENLAELKQIIMNKLGE